MSLPVYLAPSFPFIAPKDSFFNLYILASLTDPEILLNFYYFWQRYSLKTWSHHCLSLSFCSMLNPNLKSIHFYFSISLDLFPKTNSSYLTPVTISNFFCLQGHLVQSLYLNNCLTNTDKTPRCHGKTLLKKCTYCSLLLITTKLNSSVSIIKILHGLMPNYSYNFILLLMPITPFQ